MSAHQSMNHLVIRRLVVKELADRQGWRQHPDQDNRYVHAETGVNLVVYRDELAVTFGTKPGERYDKAVAAKTNLYPSLAVASALEVADALVETRRRAAHRAAVAGAQEQAPGDGPAPGQ